MKATGKNAELKTALLSLEREENDDEQVIVKVAARNAGKTPKRKQTFPPVWPRMHTDPKGLKMLLQEVSKDSFGSDVNQHSFRSVKHISGEELEISTACCDCKYKKWKHKDGRDCNAVQMICMQCTFLHHGCQRYYVCPKCQVDHYPETFKAQKSDSDLRSKKKARVTVFEVSEQEDSDDGDSVE